MNKGSDMAVFGVQPEGSDRNAVIHIDEIAQYQAGRYISSSEAVWRILSFPIHERSPWKRIRCVTPGETKITEIPLRNNG